MKKESHLEKYGLILIGIMGLLGGSVKAYELFLDKDSNSISSLVPSDYDLNLQKEGVLDKKFRYTNNPIVYELYRSTTKEINSHTPLDMGMVCK